MKTIGMAVAATVLTCMCSFSATAAVRQVDNVDDPINHPYSQSGSNNCTVEGYCTIVFSATTASETLVSHVSCVYFLATGASTGVAYVTNISTGDTNYLPINGYANGGNGADHSMNDNTYLFFQSGLQPRVEVYSSGGPVQQMQCTISGYHN